MATDTWNGGSGNWTVAADWSTGAPPGATDVADIASGDPQITSNVGTVGAVDLDAASLSVEDGALSVAQGLDNAGGKLDIDNDIASYSNNVYTPPAGGSTVSVAGTLANTGSVMVGNANLSAATTVNVGAIANSGTLEVTGDIFASATAPQATVVVAGAAGLGMTGAITGSVSIDYNAALQFGSGGITTIASGSGLQLTGSRATIGLAGSNVHNAALAGLSANYGSLQVLSDTINTSATNFSNTGTILVNDLGIGTASLAIAGTLTNTGEASLFGGSISASALNQGNGGLVSFNTVSGVPSGPNTVTLNGGASNISGTVTGTGTLDFEGGSAVVDSGAKLMASNVTLGGNTHVEIATSAADATSAFGFATNATATLQLDASVLPSSGGTLSNLIVRLGAGDNIDLRGLGFASGATATYNATNGTLAVTSNGVTDNLSLALPQTTTFQATSDGNGGTEVTAANVVCFASGTLIRTVRGDVAVERLAVGDRVVTASGGTRPVAWIGHRSLDCRRALAKHAVLPIRIAADAFGEGRPARDLRVSPGHAICVDACGEALIPAAALVNGTTIVREHVDAVTYWHVELDGGHDVILAENLPCESYLDMGNRTFFAEGRVSALHAAPDARIVTHADFCRPYREDGPLVAAVRQRLATRASKVGKVQEPVAADCRSASARR